MIFHFGKKRMMTFQQLFFSSRFSPKKVTLMWSNSNGVMAIWHSKTCFAWKPGGFVSHSKGHATWIFRGSWDTFLQSTPICLTFQNWNFQVASTRKHVWGGFHDFHNFGIFLNGWCWLPSRCSLRQKCKNHGRFVWGGRMEDGSLPLRPCNWPLQETGMMKRRC